MGATRLENATTSYNSRTAVNGFAVGSARGHFRPIRCQRRRNDHYNPDEHGITGRPWRCWTVHFTDAIPFLHGGTDYDRSGPEWLLHRSVHPPVRSREDVRSNSPDRHDYNVVGCRASACRAVTPPECVAWSSSPWLD